MRISILFIYLTFLSLSVPMAAMAGVADVGDEEQHALYMFFEEKDLVLSPTRAEKPLSYVAENMTVMSDREILERNYHTLVDVLRATIGVDIAVNSTPGIPSAVQIHGSEFKHVLVTIDGIPLNNLIDGFADIGALPVQNIERVEIIKGPASSSWGSSLGGMVNIITKSPSDKHGATLSSSYGEKDTGDFRAELSGREGKIGYYFFGGRLESDGLRPNTDVSAENLYGKLEFDFAKSAKAFLTIGYNEGLRGLSEVPQFDVSFNNGYKHIYSTFGARANILDGGELDISLRTLTLDSEIITAQSSTGLQLDKTDFNDETYGGSLKFTYRHKSHTFVIGSDIDNGTLTSNKITGGKQELDKWAVYANDTIAIEKWSFTPGVRYDYTSTNDDFVSPTFGITYSPHESTTLRATVARGFNLPPLAETFGTGTLTFPQFIPNPDLKVERVQSYQAGFETEALKYLRLKGAVFRHDVRDAIAREQLSATSFMSVNKDKIRRQGFEVETKTMPVHNTSISAGFAFTDTEDRITGETIRNLPRYSWDIEAEYNTERFKGIIEGRYVWWNADAALKGKYDAFVWDMNLTSTLYARNERSLDTFLTVHNIFNASQYPESMVFKNPERWVEAGLRVRF
jgi:vitamin B12 transporter